MLNRTYNVVKPAEEVLDYLRANKSGCQALRRRAVIYKSDGKWILQSCVVEGISINQCKVKKEQPREYSEAVLFEDWLTFDGVNYRRIGAISLSALSRH